jgi:hypothetical protein
MPRLKAGKKGESIRMGVKITSRQADRRMACDFMRRAQSSQFTSRFHAENQIQVTPGPLLAGKKIIARAIQRPGFR